MNRRFIPLVALAIPLATPAFSQHPPGEQGSRNIHIVSHLPMGQAFSTSDVEIEQELSRPYAYQSRMVIHGMDIINLNEPSRPEVIYSWRIEDAELHVGTGGMDNKYFKLNSRYYDVQSTQFSPAGPDADLCGVVFDVTGLPDAGTVKEVGRIRAPDTPGGCHNIFAYKHSSGRVLLFTTSSTTHANVYDMERFLAGDGRQGLVGRVPGSDPAPSTYGMLRGYHDMYVGYDPATRQDKFYGPSYSAFYVYDVTQPEEPKLLTSISGAAGLEAAHTFTPTPDGRYAIGELEYQYAPLRIFDLKPGLDGEVQTISRPIGAWTARWQGLAHNHEVRWPYVFVSAYEDGLHVFNMMDPTNPYTVGSYDTYDGPDQRGFGMLTNEGWGGARSSGAGNTVFNGAFGVDVRNADGLIVISDFTTGFWTFKMDGFDGWNGHQWGMPNVSSAQDWDNGPDGAPPPARVS